MKMDLWKLAGVVFLIFLRTFDSKRYKCRFLC